MRSSPPPRDAGPKHVWSALALAGAVAAFAGSACAQGSWTIGRPEPLPEFQPPNAPTPAKAKATAPAPTRQMPQAPLAADATFAHPGQSVALSEVLVVGRPPGPALWRVRKGDAELVIIGGLSPLPHLQQWNAVRVRAALTGAKALLVAPIRIGAFEGAILALRSGAIRLPGGQPLDARLPQPLRARFEAATRTAGQTPAHYARLRPAAAGAFLVSDFRRTAGFSSAKPGSTLERMAKAQGVPVRTLPGLSLAPFINSLLGLPEAQQLACLNAAVDEIDEERARARAASQAWADGKLAQVQANWSTALLEGCALPNARVQALLEQGTETATRDMEAMLRSPGRTVALVDLHFLLRANGLLDRLEADGAQVTVPR